MARKIKVLYIIGGNDDKYGAHKLASNIIELMTRRHDISYCVFTARDGLTNKRCQKNGVENYYSCFKYSTYVPLKNPFLNAAKHVIKKVTISQSDKRAIKEIEKKIDIPSFDIIHSNMNRDLIGGYLSTKYKKPHVWHLQEMYDSHFGLRPIYNRQLQWMNSNCDKYIAISNTVANDWVKHGLDPGKIQTIHNGIDLGKYKKRESTISDARLKIVMAGLIYKEKGQEQLIEALSKLPKPVLDKVQVDFYGEAKPEYREYLNELIDRFALNDKINFRGYSNSLPSLLCEYDIGINCSKGEGFGLSTLEYMASGLCVLVSNCGANLELITNLENGLIFEYGNTQSLANCIEKIYIDKILRNKLMENAYKISLGYSCNRCIDQLYEVYDNLLKESQNKR